MTIAVTALIACAAWLISFYAALDWQVAFPLDDSYIHLQYAMELAEGRPFSYDAGDPRSTGATSTLWPLLLAPPFFLGEGELPLAWTFCLAALLLSMAGATLYVAARPIAGVAASAVSSLALVLNPWLLATSLSGMESPLIALSVTLALAALVHRRWRLLALALVLVALSRPEGAIAAALIGVTLAVGFLRKREPGRAAWLAAPVVATFLQLTAWFMVSGRLGTDTAIVKSVLYDPGLPFGLKLVTWVHELGRSTGQFVVGFVGSEQRRALPGEFLVLPGVPAALAVAGAAMAWGRGRRDLVLAGAAIAGMYLAVTASADWSGHHFRYLTPVLTVLVFFGAPALAAMDRASPRWRPGLLVGIAIILASVAWIPRWHDRAVGEAADLRGQHVLVADWLASNLTGAPRIGFHDAGALKYHSQLPHLDWLGLVTPGQAEAFRAGYGSVYERLASLPADQRPDVWVMWTDVFPRLQSSAVVGRALFRSPDLGPEPYVFAPTMTVYGADWSTVKLSDRVPAPWPRDIWRLDVADLEAEHRFSYRADGLRPHRPAIADELVTAPTSGGVPISDGCRAVRAEQFRVPSAGTLVARLAGDSEVMVIVDGAPVGRLRSSGDGFSEPSLRLARAGMVEVAAVSGAYVSCHYWLVQG